VDRLSGFDASMATAEAAGQAEPRISLEPGQSRDLAVSGLQLRVPSQAVILQKSDFSFPRGQRSLLMGPSGSGKSTLFRAIAGIWPFGEGKVLIPEGDSVMLLPQRPYMPMGTLRGAVSYPALEGAYTDAAIRDALVEAKLPLLTARLDDVDIWTQRLSGGEQQRLAIARALLARPQWLMLDEATAALDEPTEEAIYGVLRTHLPDTTIISIGHRSTLAALHDRVVRLEPHADGGHVPELAGGAGKPAPVRRKVTKAKV
jgi:vitamin B12/bleomycin/antimicrobial peptide transport system ATP-binding/permease protein